jgi:hypothetical protein
MGKPDNVVFAILVPQSQVDLIATSEETPVYSTEQEPIHGSPLLFLVSINNKRILVH